MRLDDIPLFSMLKGRLTYLNQRQAVIAQNVANADVAGFTPKDLKPQSFSDVLNGHGAGGGLQMAMTAPGHLAGSTAWGGGAGGVGSTGGAEFQTQGTPDSETKMNGNSVVLEEQMLKMSESRMDYDAAIGFYQHSLNMLRMAARRPGG